MIVFQSVEIVNITRREPRDGSSGKGYQLLSVLLRGRRCELITVRDYNLHRPWNTNSLTDLAVDPPSVWSGARGPGITWFAAEDQPVISDESL